MPLKLQINAEDIASRFGDLAKEVEKDIRQSVKELANLTRAQITEEAANGEKDKETGTGGKLTSTLNIYLENLSPVETSSPGVWVITLNEPAMWIEEGIKPDHDMKPDLLKGRKYRVIPFRYNTKPTQTTPDTNNLISQIKTELKKHKISYSKIDYDKTTGSPRVGKIHDLKWGQKLEGGNDIPGKGNTPRLKGLSIYQKENQKTGKIERHILTFRTVSSGPKSAGKWIHPGRAAKKYFEKAFMEAERKWEQEILPELKKYWETK